MAIYHLSTKPVSRGQGRNTPGKSLHPVLLRDEMPPNFLHGFRRLVRSVAVWPQFAE